MAGRYYHLERLAENFDAEFRNQETALSFADVAATRAQYSVVSPTRRIDGSPGAPFMAQGPAELAQRLL